LVWRPGVVPSTSSSMVAKSGVVRISVCMASSAAICAYA